MHFHLIDKLRKVFRRRYEASRLHQNRITPIPRLFPTIVRILRERNKSARWLNRKDGKSGFEAMED